VCVCVCVSRTGSNQSPPQVPYTPPPSPPPFAIKPVYPTTQKSSVGQVYRVHTLSRYNMVCAEQHKYFQGATLVLICLASALWLSLASTNPTNFPRNHYKWLVTYNNVMSFSGLLKLLSSDICVACLRILHCSVQTVMFECFVHWQYVPEQMSCHRGKE
jgi:hypothetical protein